MTGIKQRWQDQKGEDEVIPLDDLRVRAGRLKGRVRWRTILLCLFFSVMGLTAVRALVRTIAWHAEGRTPDRMFGSWFAAEFFWLMAIAMFFWLAFATWWRGRVKPMPAEMAGEAALDFYRREVERQRQAAASAWVWFVLPYAIPCALGLAWVVFRFPQQNMHLLPTLGLFELVFFGATWLAFSRSAARLEAELERLRRLRAE